MKEFVTITFSDKLNVMKSCLSSNHSSDEMKRLGDESCSSQKTIFLVVKLFKQERNNYNNYDVIYRTLDTTNFQEGKSQTDYLSKLRL
jgi:hypothetical protein